MTSASTDNGPVPNGASSSRADLDSVASVDDQPGEDACGAGWSDVEDGTVEANGLESPAGRPPSLITPADSLGQPVGSGPGPDAGPSAVDGHSAPSALRGSRPTRPGQPAAACEPTGPRHSASPACSDSEPVDTEPGRVAPLECLGSDPSEPAELCHATRSGSPGSAEPAGPNHDAPPGPCDPDPVEPGHVAPPGSSGSDEPAWSGHGAAPAY
jgi:hypothetical protein